MDNLLHFLALKVRKEDIDMNVLNFFFKYRHNRQIFNENFDCSEIADDFEDLFQQGKVYRIKPKKLLGEMNFIEFSGLKKYEFHDVFVHNGVAYDPRLFNLNREKPTYRPIYWDDYKSLVKLLNTVEYTVRER